MKDNRPTITIKLKPYLQEFVVAELRGGSLVSGYQILGKLLRPFIQRRPPEIPPSFPTGPEYIVLQLPLIENIDLRDNNYYITDENQKLIEFLLDIHFKKLFYNYMKDKERFVGRNITNCILQFCLDYNFCFTNINPESLKKFYYRERIRQKKLNNFPKKVSRNCPDIVPESGQIDFPFFIRKI